MSRTKALLAASSLASLTANLLAVIGYLDKNLFPGRQFDVGSLLAFSFVSATYVLSVWSAYAWRWSRPSNVARTKKGDSSQRTSMFLMNALAAFPLATLWVYLLASAVLEPDVSSIDRWLLALASAWMISPFMALGLVAVGEILGPILNEENE